MNQKITCLLFYGITPVFLLFSNLCRGQIYYPITHLSGTQNVNGINVTVTGTGSASSYANYCGAGPYWIGLSSISGPGSYSFAFSVPVGNVKLEITAMDNGEIISFNVNGSPYTLTNSNLSPFPGTCGNQLGTIVSGDLHAPGISNPGGGGEIIISGVINNIEVHANGMMNGTIFNMYYGGIKALSNSPVCEGDSLFLYVIPEIDGASYTWEGPAGFRSSAQDPVIPEATLVHEGNYIVKVITGSDTLIDSTYVYIKPSPKTIISFQEPVCLGSDLELSAPTSYSDVAYLWVGPADFFTTDPNPVIPNVGLINSGQYTVTTSLDGCTFIADTHINVLQPSILLLTETICSNEGFEFNGSLLTREGLYSDTLVNHVGCDSIIMLNLFTLPPPEISVSFDPVDLLCLGDTLMLRAEGASYYLWYDNTKLFNERNAHLAYKIPNLKNQVWVVGIDENGCRDTTLYPIEVDACCEMFVPNVFSPNGDGVNDEFGPIPHGNITGYKMQLFNRWGEMIFVTADINKKWNGIYKGKPADGGVYYYLISAFCLEGTELLKKGDVSLVR